VSRRELEGALVCFMALALPTPAIAEESAAAPAPVVVPVPAAPAAPPPIVPPGPANPDGHLGSSSRSRSDISGGDDFDLGRSDGGGAVVRGNPDAPGIVVDDLEGNSGVYTVRSGDTLGKISQQVYGQPWMWPKLWSLNPQIQNPHWIYPGDQVRLTDAATGLGRPSQVRTLGAGGLVDRRAALPEDTVFLRRTGYLDDPEKGIQGEVIGAKAPVQLMSDGDTVYLAIRPGTNVSPGQRLTIFRPSREPPKVKGARTPPGMIVAIQGTVTVDYYDPKSQVARGTITESLDVIERGAKVGDLGRRFEVVPPKKATTDVSARILTGLYPHAVLGDEQVVFIDRGYKDGLEPGHRLFVVRRGDTWRRTLSTAAEGARTRLKMDSDERVDSEPTPLNGDEQAFPEEIVGELRILDAQPYSSYALVTEARAELYPGDRAIARSGF
jgi:hypothetical protein